MNKRQYKYSMVFPVSQTKSVVKAINQAVKNSQGAVEGDGSGVSDGATVADIEVKKSKQCCQPFGRTTFLWGAGRYYPIKGEDQSYQIYRKRDCCQKVYGYGD
ncbi:TraU family protein [Acinetobacter sp. SwsAc5]|nr:TraU family protein [Acinetobacter sp. SwsAc5]